MYGFQMKGSAHQFYRFHSRKMFYSILKSSQVGVLKGTPVGIAAFGVLSLQQYLTPKVGSLSWILSIFAVSIPFAIKYPSKNLALAATSAGLILSGLDYSATSLLK